MVIVGQVTETPALFEGSAIYNVLPGNWVEFGISGDAHRNSVDGIAVDVGDIRKKGNRLGAVAMVQERVSDEWRLPAVSRVVVNLKANADFDAKGVVPFGTVVAGMSSLEELRGPFWEKHSSEVAKQYAKEGNKKIWEHYRDATMMRNVTAVWVGSTAERAIAACGDSSIIGFLLKVVPTGPLLALPAGREAVAERGVARTGAGRGQGGGRGDATRQGQRRASRARCLRRSRRYLLPVQVRAAVGALSADDALFARARARRGGDGVRRLILVDLVTRVHAPVTRTTC